MIFVLSICASMYQDLEMCQIGVKDLLGIFAITCILTWLRSVQRLYITCIFHGWEAYMPACLILTWCHVIQIPLHSFKGILLWINLEAMIYKYMMGMRRRWIMLGKSLTSMIFAIICYHSFEAAKFPSREFYFIAFK